MTRRIVFTIMITLIAAACQPTSVPSEDEPLPTVFVLPSVTTIPTETPIPLPTETPTSTLTPPATDTPTPSPTETVQVFDIPTLPPTETAVPRPDLPELFSFGRSVQGRDLIARRIGNGPRMLMLIGGIHGGWESNTSTLVDELHTHFQITPGDVLPGVTLVFISTLNPDGAALGRTLDGRFNFNRVDLNRNWGCGWEAVAYFQDQQVSPGAQPFSEPETLALAALINDLRPSTVLFYHSAANGIFGGNCGGNSSAMVEILGLATGYPYGGEFTDYVVTGTAPNWVDSLGIPSADVELATANATELERNIQGVIALQCWVLAESAQGFPACESG